MLLLKYVSEIESEEISNFVKELTNKSVLNIDEIYYEIGIMNVRLKIKKDNKKNINEYIINIFDVENVNIIKEEWIRNNITILFGLIMKDKQYYLSSVEEKRGRIGFEMKINVKKWNIDIKEM